MLVDQCRVGPDLYLIYGHRGRKYSIFKNDIQGAWWDRKAVTWFAGDNYKIIADKDCDIDLIISFCLIVDNFSRLLFRWRFIFTWGSRVFQSREFAEHILEPAF